MKKIASKVQRLGQRAAEIRQAIESVPPKIEEVREIVAQATGHVQKLRAEIVSGVATLRAESDAQLVEALREIDASAELLAEAGCEVERVDMDLGPTRRLVVHLQRADDIDLTDVRVLLAENEHRPVLRALLSAIIKAEELAGKVQLQHLRHNKLTIDIGLIPAVRIGWTSESAEMEPQLTNAAPTTPLPQPLAAPSATPLGHSSFFPRAPVASVVVTPAAPAVAVAASPIVAVAKAEPPPSATGAVTGPSSPLERFKRMPDLTKRTR